MKIILVLAFVLSASAALGGDIVARTEHPDIGYIGDGWPSNLTPGCFERHECEIPKDIEVKRPAVMHPAPQGQHDKDPGAWYRCMARAQRETDVARSFEILGECANMNP